MRQSGRLGIALAPPEMGGETLVSQGTRVRVEATRTLVIFLKYGWWQWWQLL